METKKEYSHLCDVVPFSFDTDCSLIQCKSDANILAKKIKSSLINNNKKKYLNLLIKSIKKGKISFNNGISSELADIIINLSVEDIYDLSKQNKNSIIAKLYYMYNEKGYKITIDDSIKIKLNNKKTSEIIMDLPNKEFYGINNEDVEKIKQKTLALILLYEGFLTSKQQNYLKKFFSNEKLLINNLNDTLTENQKEILQKNSINLEILASELIYYGIPSFYRLSNLRNIFPEIIDKKEYENGKKILQGRFEYDFTKKIFSEKKIFQYEIKDFIPKEKNIKTIRNLLKNIKKISSIQNHNEVNRDLNNLKKLKIKIPNILVNIDTHSDIYVNKNTNNSIADWVNKTLIDNNEITDIYWVLPSKAIRNPFSFVKIFSNYNLYSHIFCGNYNRNILYKDLRKPLTQVFLYNPKTGYLISDSANYSKEKLKKELLKGEYKQVRVHTCTEKNLPKINREFILSIDADFFNCCGFDTDMFFEHISDNNQDMFNNFIKLWKQKLSKASIVELCLSPEYIGYDSIAETRGFFEYLIKEFNQIKLN